MEARKLLTLLLLLMLPSWALQAQITLPVNGNSQKASVTQYIGLVSIRVDYSSPNVISPTGEDRTGKIWGQLVPYGLAQNNFGTSKAMPWRAGANENTTISLSHDVMVEGKMLPAGTYGLHIIPAEKEAWTVIFSKNATSWGSFFYNPEEDALRVKAMPQQAPLHQWLTYEFTERKPDAATLTLSWEKLSLPIHITVPDINSYYLTTIRNELRSSAGFQWQSWAEAAAFCAQNNMNLPEALTWADNAISNPSIGGQANFFTLQTKASVLSAMGRQAQSDSVMRVAIALPQVQPYQIHQYGRQLLAEGKKQEALDVFKLNAKKNKDAWPVNVGLARGYSAVGDYKNALKYARLAAAQAPDPVNKSSLENMIKLLQDGKDVNVN